MDQEVEEVSFLPGEVILNKKAIYEPNKAQRCHQIVCSRGWAVGILLVMGTVMVAIAVIAAFARPSLLYKPHTCATQEAHTSDPASLDQIGQEDKQTYLSTNNEPFPWRDLRLPRDILPEAYTIFLHPNLTEGYFTGNIHMNLRVLKSTDFIVFHLKQLNISNIKVFTAQSSPGQGSLVLTYKEPVQIAKELHYPGNEQYYLGLSTPLAASALVQVQVDFRGSLDSLFDMAGFYKSSYTVRGQTRFMASTQFEPTDARKAFPCFDEPDLKANFTMSIVRDQKHITLFNTPLKRTAPFRDDLVVDEYEESVKMSTYLVAYVVCDFKNISATTKGGVLVRVFASEDKIQMAELALDTTVKILDHYTDFFGIPFPLPKQDSIAIPNFEAGAMENWGLITYREATLLYDPELSSAIDKKNVIVTVAHELAHQWFGNLVTMTWWEDLWLNEGFATFVESYIGTDFVDPSFKSKYSSVYASLNAMASDSSAYSHPIAVTVGNPAEIGTKFDEISYHKGAAVIHMLSKFMGDIPFKKGLKNYLTRHQYGNAQSSDLWDAMQEISLPPGLTVAGIMNTWTKQMGLPVVTVTRSHDQLLVSQERFLIGGVQSKNLTDKTHQSPYGYKWIIPFTYKTSLEPNQTSLAFLQNSQNQVNLSNIDGATWIKANVDSQGFYRVNYAGDGWQHIIQQLKTDHTIFSAEDRMGLIDDIFYLARSGYTNYSTALELTKYLVQETNVYVLVTAIFHLGFIKARLYLEEEHDLVKRYTLSLFKSQIETTGWEKQADHINEIKQSVLLGTGINQEYQKVIDEALGYFNHWKTNTTLDISNGLRLTVVSQGVKSGGDTEWDLVWNRYLTEVVPSERNNLMEALSSTKDARLLQILLKYSLDGSKIKSQDGLHVMTSVGGNYNGHLFAWKFLRENYDLIIERFGSSFTSFNHLIYGVVARFSSQFEYDEVLAFFKNKKVDAFKGKLEQALDILQDHIEWQKKYMPAVKSWFQSQASLVETDHKQLGR